MPTATVADSLPEPLKPRKLKRRPKPVRLIIVDQLPEPVKPRKLKRRPKPVRLIIVDQLPEKTVEPVPPKLKTKKPKPPRRVFAVEAAKSGRGRCAGCKELIEKGSPRLGVITFYPHRSARWHHAATKCLCTLSLTMTPENLKGFSAMDAERQASLTSLLEKPPPPAFTKQLTSLSGSMSMPQMAMALSGRYQRFRSFRFGLPEGEMYTPNWDWRCFLATILVCNSKETSMLKVTDKLFKRYPDQASLLGLWGEKEEQKALKNDMEKDKLRHVGRKMFSILNATKYLVEQHDGKVPASREELMTLPGVGSHVSSVTMAWVHESPEFGVDVHVRRILERWGYIGPKDPEDVIEAKVKAQVPAKDVGHFSRAFVDHGQTVCGYTPDCGNCYLNKACPTASKFMDW
jgi:endonuclease-3